MHASDNPIAQHATGGAILRLALVNGLLNLVTLSWWRFWGNTRVRRLLWSHTTLWGEPLEYTGTGRELFLGFLIVLVLVLAPLGVAFVVLEQLAAIGDPLAATGFLALQAVVLFLVGAGLYRARRYRLSRTLWRGIRGGQEGSAWVYGAKFVLGLIAAGLTLGWLWPYVEMGLERYKMAHTTFGNRRFACHSSSRKTYGRFALIYVGGLTVLGVGAVLATLVGFGGDPVLMAAVPLGLFLLAIPLVLVPVARYRARVYQVLAEGTRFGETRFRFDPTTGAFIRLALGNWLLTTLTLGLLRPVAAWRTFRFTAAHLRIDGRPDFDAIAQGAAPTDRTGEGLAAAFDGAGAL